MKITIVGAGYVGLANAILLAQHHEVFLLDINAQKIALLQEKKSPLRDPEMEQFLSHKSLQLFPTTNADEAYYQADFIIIATPTNYDDSSGYFDTRSVESVVEKIMLVQPDANIVIKSTVPVGFTRQMQIRHPNATILFSPEFLREGRALYDNLYPSRIIIGGNKKVAQQFADFMQQGAFRQDIPLLFTGETEAEAIKLFANTYLAMRVSFFNELDTFAEANHLHTKEIIEGVCLDPRIGNHYNNPSFGYGGYCLPKDTKQLLANYHHVSNTLIRAIVESNETRKNVIINNVLKYNIKTVGIYRLIMKSGSDNFRASAILDIMGGLSVRGLTVIVYEPTLSDTHYQQYPIIHNLDSFKERADIILANRMHRDLHTVKHKVYTRDIFGND